MRNIGIWFVGMICFMLVMISISLAAESEIFGPQQYTRSIGPSDSYTNSFTAAPMQGRLLVLNGNETQENGKNRNDSRVSSAKIFLNGELILSSNDFNQNVYRIEKSINLLKDNTLTVNLNSKPESFLTISIFQDNQLEIEEFKAEPNSISLGDSTLLSWSVPDAVTCSITPIIDAVACTGAIRVSPEETTTFTISATGPEGGTVEASTVVTVTIPRPTVTINAMPSIISQGDYSELTWTANNADTCFLDQGIDEVPCNSSVIVFPSTDTTYTITATGAGGTESASTTISVNSAITIDYPAGGDVISGSKTMVTGTINKNFSEDFGVTVNDYPAIIGNGQFIVNDVPVIDGENLLAVVLTTESGDIFTDDAYVQAETNNKHISISCKGIESGIAPLEVEMEVTGNFLFATSVEITDSGPFNVVYLSSEEPDVFRVELQSPGIYFFTAEVRDDQGILHTSTIAVEAADKIELDTLLKARWDGMKTALATNNIESSLDYFVEGSREKYRYLFEKIGSLPDFAAAMQDIEIASFANNIATYRIQRIETIDGVPTEITYFIYFKQDSDGRYKIYKF